MKSPLSQLLLLSVFVGIGLWVGIKWFLGGTGNFTDSIDIRSVEYRPEQESASGQSQKTQSSPSDPLPPAAFGAPKPMLTVEELTERAEAASKEAEEGQTQAGDEGVQEQEDDQEEGIEEKTAEEAEAIERVETAESDSAEQFNESSDQQAENTESASENEQLESAALGSEELELRESARKQRLAELGLIQEKPPEPTIAVDVSLVMSEHCEGAAVARVPVGLKFRYESSLIKGESLNALESLVALYRDCEQGEFVLEENPLGRTDANETLKQMRFDEVKYFFIQHSVSIDAVRFPEKQ